MRCVEEVMAADDEAEVDRQAGTAGVRSTRRLEAEQHGNYPAYFGH
jgi:hypothetical protein